MVIRRRSKDDILEEALKYVYGMDIPDEDKLKLYQYLTILSNPFYVSDVLSIPKEGENW